MSVYVDLMFNCLAGPKWPWGEACHMVADSVEELVAFAVKIGLKKSWLQHGAMPHFDLTRSKRLQAVSAGAVEITAREAATRLRAWRGMHHRKPVHQSTSPRVNE